MMPHVRNLRYDRYEFNVWKAKVSLPIKDTTHIHSDIEVNFLLSGSMRYFLSGRFVTIHAGRLSAFWAGTPHHILSHSPGIECIWVNVPLSWFMQWDIAEPARRHLFAGNLLQEPDHSAATSFLDRALLERWVNDLRPRRPKALRRVVELEVEARLIRLSAQPTVPARDHDAGTTSARATQIEQVSAYIGEHYTDVESVAEIARAVGLHPNYLMHVFRKSTGMRLWDYVIHQRITHAQRLLMMSGLKVIDVALESGFGSVSRFHDAFRRLCGRTPRQYRAEFQKSR